MLSAVPYSLIGLRFLLGPVLFVGVIDGEVGPWFLAGLVAAFLSDVFDGVIARRTGAVTAFLREVDGHVDVWFYVWIATSAWLVYSDLLRAYLLPLLAVLGSQILSWTIDWLKFRRFSNYHTYTAKAWGIALLVTSIALFGFQQGGVLLWPTILFGFLCTFEEIAITLTLPSWQFDVPSLFHARREVDITETELF